MVNNRKRFEIILNLSLLFLFLISLQSCKSSNQFLILNSDGSTHDKNKSIFQEGNFKILYDNMWNSWDREGNVIYGFGIDSEFEFVNNSDTIYKVLDVNCKQIYKGKNLSLPPTYYPFSKDSVYFPLSIDQFNLDNPTITHISFPISKLFKEFNEGDTIFTSFQIKLERMGDIKTISKTFIKVYDTSLELDWTPP